MTSPTAKAHVVSMSKPVSDMSWTKAAPDALPFSRPSTSRSSVWRRRSRLSIDVSIFASLGGIGMAAFPAPSQVPEARQQSRRMTNNYQAQNIGKTLLFQASA
jgi:hypothetical protein